MANEQVTINKVELASELAHEKLVKNWSSTIQIFEDECDGESHYTDEAQEIFNEYYDIYYQIIELKKV